MCPLYLYSLQSELGHKFFDQICGRWGLSFSPNYLHTCSSIETHQPHMSLCSFAKRYWIVLCREVRPQRLMLFNQPQFYPIFSLEEYGKKIWEIVILTDKCMIEKNINKKMYCKCPLIKLLAVNYFSERSIHLI